MDKIIFGQYYPISSWIHRLDPRVKIVSMFSLMISLFLVDNLFVLLGFLTFLLIVIISSKVPIGKFFNSIKMMSFVLVLTFFLQIIFRKEGKIIADLEFTLTYFSLGMIIIGFLLSLLLGKKVKFFKTSLFIVLIISLMALQYFTSIGPSIIKYNIRIYETGLMMASYIVLRIMALLFVSSLLTLTTKPTELNNGLDSLLKPLKKIGVNVSVFTMMISIALRFIPTLIEEANKILKAQASRGADFKESKFSEKIGQIVSLIVPMFVIAYKRAYDLADAMEARGYIPENERTSIYLLKYRMNDYFVIFVNIIIFAGAIYLRVGYAI